MQENAILVKLAGEISLKSDSVKKRFTETLKQNLVTALEKNKIKLTEIRQKPGRFLIFCNDLEKAQKILSKVFGIHSIALVYFFESKIKQEILETCANYSLPFLENKKTFAVKSKREGTHAFTS
ncbi:MAG: THUMP domain-containing protein, partial [Candidatus Diapherotrites archaeon]|nr:THUMP domain-containing protein [Candidatus Diapherotrites archaeon]